MASVAVAALPVVFWLSVGKSAATAIEGTPVPVVFLTMPVARLVIDTPLIPLAEVAVVAVVARVAVAALPVVDWFSVGKSPATAIDGAPVLVVFFTMPVARPAIETLLILVTVSTPEASVTSPVWVMLETLAVLVTCWLKIAALIKPLTLDVAVGITSVPPVMWVLAWVDGTETPASEMVNM